MVFLSLLLVVVVIGLLYICCILPGKSGCNLPPFPVRPLPVVGHLFALASNQRSKFKEWRKKCGDMYSLKIGSNVIVMLNGYQLFKETLLQRADEFSDRPITILDTFTGSSGAGVVTASGPVWKEQRSITLSLLRSFGLGSNVLAVRTQDEISHYLEYLSQFHGLSVDLRLMTHISTSNIICSIMLGHRFEYTDLYFRSMMQKLDEMFRTFTISSLVNFFPILRFVPGDFFAIKKSKRDIGEVFRMFDTFIERYRDSDSDDNFIAGYLKEQKKKLQNGEKTTLNDTNLRKVLFDLFIAGTETTSSTICSMFLYLSNYPDVQRKVFEEINEHVGTERLPTMKDKPKMSYTNAVILETQRLASIAANGFVHTCPRDVTVRGFTIPKGAYILPSLDSILHDEKIWGQDVMSFRPDRFLDQDGKLKIPEEFIPFLIGKRACLGESMANTELFLYLTNMIQRFEFQPIDADHPPPMKFTFGLTVIPEPFQVKILSRLHCS